MGMNFQLSNLRFIGKEKERKVFTHGKLQPQICKLTSANVKKKGWGGGMPTLISAIVIITF